MPKTSTRRAFLRRHAAIAAGVATTALVAGPVVTAVARDAPFVARIKGEPRSARPLDIKSAAATFDRAGAPAVKITLTPASAKVFGDLTRRNVGKEMELLYGGEGAHQRGDPGPDYRRHRAGDGPLYDRPDQGAGETADGKLGVAGVPLGATASYGRARRCG